MQGLSDQHHKLTNFWSLSQDYSHGRWCIAPYECIKQLFSIILKWRRAESIFQNIFSNVLHNFPCFYFWNHMHWNNSFLRLSFMLVSSCYKERKVQKISCLSLYFPLVNIHFILRINKEQLLLLHAGGDFVILSHPDVSSIRYWKYSYCLERVSCYKYFKQQFVNFGSDPTAHRYFSHAFTPNCVMKMPHEAS